MPKTFPFWAFGTAAILLLCGIFVCPVPTGAGQGRSAASHAAADSVQNGTHFLVRLDQEMNTGKDKVNKKFEVKTLEPLETSSGSVLPAGARILGHISRIEPGGLTGHARVWLTFDDIDTSRGTLPIVAEVSSVPGEFSVRAGESKEGEIEARTSKGTQVLEATAAGAAMGSAAGSRRSQRQSGCHGRRGGRRCRFSGVLWNRPGNRFAERDEARTCPRPAALPESVSIWAHLDIEEHQPIENHEAKGPQNKTSRAVPTAFPCAWLLTLHEVTAHLQPKCARCVKSHVNGYGPRRWLVTHDCLDIFLKRESN